MGAFYPCPPVLAAGIARTKGNAGAGAVPDARTPKRRNAAGRAALVWIFVAMQQWRCGCPVRLPAHARVASGPALATGAACLRRAGSSCNLGLLKKFKKIASLW